jgi:hypothetical protein
MDVLKGRLDYDLTTLNNSMAGGIEDKFNYEVSLNREEEVVVH